MPPISFPTCRQSAKALIMRKTKEEKRNDRTAGRSRRPNEKIHRAREFQPRTITRRVAAGEHSSEMIDARETVTVLRQAGHRTLGVLFHHPGIPAEGFLRAPLAPLLYPTNCPLLSLALCIKHKHKHFLQPSIFNLNKKLPQFLFPSITILLPSEVIDQLLFNIQDGWTCNERR